MTTDQWIAVSAALGNGVAGIGAAIAAGIMSWQAWQQRRLERERYDWLQTMMLRLRNGQRVIEDADLPMALHWIREGVLEMYPPSSEPSRFMVRARTEGR